MTQSTNPGDEARRRVAKMYEGPRGQAPAGSVPPVIAPPPISLPDGPGRLAWRNTVKLRPPLLSPEELERFGNLLVFARSAVEGYFVGKHKSPYRGSSVEFADYREYIPGDEPKRIDWRAYGRSRQLFVRQYEAETDMVIYLLVDVSASMDYASTDRQSKFILAAKIAAALAYLMVQQGDKAGLVLFSDKLRAFVPPRGTQRHLHQVVRELEMIEPAFGTGIAAALSECNVLFKKRGRLVILSDFWDDTGSTFEALSQFIHRRFEILLLHVVHPHELDLPNAASVRFQDMETQGEVEVEPEEIREAYREAARERSAALGREASHRRISYAMVNTRRPYLEAIEAYLGFRGTNTLSRR